MQQQQRLVAVSAAVTAEDACQEVHTVCCLSMFRCLAGRRRSRVVGHAQSPVAKVLFQSTLAAIIIMFHASMLCTVCLHQAACNPCHTSPDKPQHQQLQQQPSPLNPVLTCSALHSLDLLHTTCLNPS
jgi:hypothetical protein